MADLIITWPKKRSLDSYLGELKKAEEVRSVICYRVPSLPRIMEGDLCYIVHDGFIRGYNVILGTDHLDDVIDPITNLRMRPGFFLIRNPRWFSLDDPVPMDGFRGYRYVAQDLWP